MNKNIQNLGIGSHADIALGHSEDKIKLFE